MAVLWLSVTSTVISVDDGLLRTNTGCAGPSSSFTLYVDWLKNIVIARKEHLIPESQANCQLNLQNVTEFWKINHFIMHEIKRPCCYSSTYAAI